MKTTLIKNAHIINATSEHHADLFLEKGKIQAIGKNLSNTADTIIDAKGLYLFPGGIDVHTHMELPTGGIFASDTFETGTKAAICGGTTTIIDFANQTKGHSIQEALDYWLNQATDHSFCDFGLHVSVTEVNESTKKEVITCFEKYGISSFKTFLAYDAMKISEKEMLDLMKHVHDLGGMITVHAEIGDIITKKIQEFQEKKLLSPYSHYLSHPDEAEVLAVLKMIELSKKTKCPIYIVHLSSGKAIQEIKKAQKDKVNILAETCPQYLFLDESGYSRTPFIEAAKFVMSPPARTKEDQKLLWEGLSQGAIEVVATDHCPFFLSQKEKGKDDFTKIPNGIPGVENRLELLFSEGVLQKKITLSQFVNITSTAPAKIFHLPNKGEIKEGYDADLVLFDPNKKHTLSAKTHHMNCDYNPYEGKEVVGQCQTVIKGGEILFENGTFLGKKPQGRYLSRKIF